MLKLIQFYLNHMYCFLLSFLFFSVHVISQMRLRLESRTNCGQKHVVQQDRNINNEHEKSCARALISFHLVTNGLSNNLFELYHRL
jgi:hypothetical protein